jgi:hypothetical protein
MIQPCEQPCAWKSREPESTALGQNRARRAVLPLQGWAGDSSTTPPEPACASRLTPYSHRRPSSLHVSLAKTAMNTGRILGRGRVLGNARSGGAPPPAPQSGPSSTKPPVAACHQRIPSYISPSSDSSTSLGSQVSASTVQDGLGAHDLVSNVSLALPDNAAAANASSRLICPICNEQMVCRSWDIDAMAVLTLMQVTLLQLNRYAVHTI